MEFSRRRKQTGGKQTGSGQQRAAARPAPGEHGSPDERAVACAAVVSAADSAAPGDRLVVALAGFREPIVVILFLIAFFTAISGKPLDGLLLLIVATGLAWDAAARYRGHAAARSGALAEPGTTASAETTPPVGRRQSVGPAHAGQPGDRSLLEQLRPGGRRLALVLAGFGFAAVYAVLVGSFIRYSWPATVGVIALGATVVATGWRGPLRHRPDPGPLPLPGAALWAVLLVAGGLWELSSLLQQPDLSATSYAHPTISALTDPVLASHVGRSVALAVWLAIGWLLVDR
ncbi:MAG TPA: hypothetical protein VLW50_02035 [Streptosporangiaceae bacterium]|nr:hypothetical protein [Streptosporangiaceae bacterium]